MPFCLPLLLNTRSWFSDFSSVHIFGWNICSFMGWFNHLLGGRVVYKENAFLRHIYSASKQVSTVISLDMIRI
ncbi:unnamed protein product [Urochloa humidicola]